MRHLRLPLDESEVRRLHAGENVLLSGRIFTARDAAHSYLVSHEELAAPCPARRCAVPLWAGDGARRGDGRLAGDGGRADDLQS